MGLKNLLLLKVFFLSLSVAVPVQKDNIDSIAGYFRSSNLKALSGQMKSTVELDILSKEGSYTKAQATAILGKFLADNKPSSVTVVHRIGANTDFRHAVLAFVSGSRYRISLSLENIDGNFLIQGVRIEADKQ